MEKMKAFVWEGNGVCGLQDVDKPTILKPSDVIGKVTVTTPCVSDVHIIHGAVPMATCPNILGHEFCVEIVEVGSEVKNYKVGDHALSNAGTSCGTCPVCRSGHTTHCPDGGLFGAITLAGSQAEYIRVPLADKTLFKIPTGYKDEDFLLVSDMYATAYFGIKNAEVKEGQNVVVMGLGAIGFCTCELLTKIYKANVIAVTRKDESLEIALKEGIAHHTVNATDPELVDKVRAFTGKIGVDSVIDTTGSEKALNQSLAMLRHSGTLSSIAVFGKAISLDVHIYQFSNIKFHIGIQQTEGVAEMMEWVKEGKLNPNFMFTHKSSLNDIMKAYEIFGKKSDGCIKWLITPYEH